MRALEVIELTGGPFRASLPEPRPHYPAVVVGPGPGTRPSSTSGSPCGWTGCGRPASSPRSRALAADGLREGPTASRALGYAQVLAQLDGVLSPEEARERTVLTTRRFVRRQRSWFRRDPATTWFDAARPDLLDAVTAVITARTIER